MHTIRAQPSPRPKRRDRARDDATSGEDLGLLGLELGRRDDALVPQVGELGELVGRGAAAAARCLLDVGAELLLGLRRLLSRSLIPFPRAITYTNTPRNGKMMTKMSQSAFPHPPRSWLRKMSKITRKRMKIQTIHRKNHSRVQKAPSTG
jgi:hypothetical protein